MTFAFTRDLALVRSVLTHPMLGRMSADDGTDIAAFEPSADERIFYISAHDDALLGIFTFVPQNAVCYEIHAAILPVAWGARSREALRGVLEFLGTKTSNMNHGVGIPRIVCAIPAYNSLAIRLAKECGFRAYGRNRASWLRWGKLHDQILLGISRA